MDQFIKPTRRAQPKHQARKTIALSAFFLLGMALLMSMGQSNYHDTNKIAYPNNFSQASSTTDLS